jgi:hypothetical protein
LTDFGLSLIGNNKWTDGVLGDDGKIYCVPSSASDILIIDTEGWELEVMKGFNHNKYKPKIIILENYLHLDSYTEYMNSIGYRLNDKSSYDYIYLHSQFEPNQIK